jgi:hypothetical protein
MLARSVSRTDDANGSTVTAIFADERARARLIADIARLIREPTVPEGTRLAGLTLIGWLARRRPHELPHSIGVEEARKSSLPPCEAGEQRTTNVAAFTSHLQAVRVKSR